MQRSGTTVTHVVLKDHPNVSMSTDEVAIAPFFTKGISTFTGGKESYRQRLAGYTGLFDLLSSHYLEDQTLALGLKAAIGNHREAIEFCNCLREYLPDVRVVLVVREDLVAQHGSLLRAERSGAWHAWEGQKTVASAPFAIAPKDFEIYALESRKTIAQLRTLHRTHDVLELIYEKDIADGVRHDRLFEFLALPVAPVTWLKMSKVAPPADTFIDNYAELTALLPSIPVSTEADEVAAATRVRRERAKDEDPSFLLNRACSQLERADLDEAYADIETALGVDAGRSLDASLCAHVCGLIEHAAATVGVPPREDLLLVLSQGRADNPYFLVERARIRLQTGDAALACDDIVGVLGAKVDLDQRTLRWAFDLLERALERRGDPVAAAQTVESLRDAYGEREHYLVLRATVEHRSGRRDEAEAMLRAALAKDPGHQRATDLLAKWFAAPRS